MEERELRSAVSAGDGGLNLGVALSILVRCDNDSLRKLCKRCKRASSSLSRRGETATTTTTSAAAFFTQQQQHKKKLEYHAIAFLWKSFQSNDAGEESLVSILKPLVEEWTSCADSVRRGLFLVLTCTFHRVHDSNFTLCLARILAEEGKETQYACILLLRNIVKDIASSNEAAVVKTQFLDVLSSLLPQLLEISAAEDSVVPTKLTSLASDCILLVIIEKLQSSECMQGDVSEALDPQSNRGLDQGLILSASRWLWEQLSLLDGFLQMHQRWAKGLSGIGEGVVCNAEVMMKALKAMAKRGL